MNIVENSYEAITGFSDMKPGITPWGFVEMEADGNPLFVVNGDMASQFNEIQIAGDPDLRRGKLPVGDDGSTILFLDDPNYAELKSRRLLNISKDIPLTEDDAFVRRWVGMAYAIDTILELGISSGTAYVDGGNWGNLQDFDNKKAMLDHIVEIDAPTKASLQAELVEAQFIIDYIAWRDTLPSGTYITYQP